ncbi:MAG: Flp pilus assembly complex ATPase component TadA [Phycisphaerae bacterium]|nr:Flp pilus assembly complex ATPase component TadA [Phycisphaerae bacterium]
MTMQTPTLLGEGLFLVSFWKPLILFVPLVGWLWVISRIYDKHAARFHLARTTWNAIHLSIGLIALLAALAIPMKSEAAFWIGLGVMIALLAADLVAYAVIANKDERVPEEFHIKFTTIFERMSKAREEKAAAKRAGKVELVIKGPDKTALPVPERDTPEFEVRIIAETLALRGMGMRASQTDIQPGKDGAYAVSFLVDGVRQPGETIPGALAVRAIDLWKSAAKLDVNDRRRKLSGDVLIEQADTKTRTRIIASGTQGGMRLTMIFDPEKAVRRKAADLGLLDNQFAELKAIAEDRQGVVLLAAPPDMGRTTTLYSVLKLHDAYTQNVQTVEMEPQDALEGIRQNPFTQEGEGPDYATFVRSILRRDPQVVGVAEMPDEQTAKEIARADHERTRTYLSLRTDNIVTAIQAWVKAVGDAEAATKCLHGALAQKLLRKLCVNCRVAYQPSADMLKKLGLPADKPRQLFKKGGQVLIKNKPEVCPVCHGIGYVGQEGIFEVLKIDKPERDLIKAGNYNGLRAEMRKRQQPSIQLAALKKLLDGITSVDELSRVTGGTEGAGAPKPAAAATPGAAAPKPPGPAPKTPATPAR